jgi:hypothetical protein
MIIDGVAEGLLEAVVQALLPEIRRTYARDLYVGWIVGPAINVNVNMSCTS